MSEAITTEPVATIPPVATEGQEPETKPQSEKHGATFAAFAKKERAIQQQMAEIKVLNEKLAQDRKEVEEFKALRGDKKKVLKHFGLNKEELKKIIEEDDMVPTAEDIQAMIQRGIKEQQLEELKAQEARAIEQEKIKKEQGEQAVVAYKKTIATDCQKAGDELELVNLFGVYDDVYGVIETTWNDHGTEVPIRDAAKQMETHLESLVEKALASKKFSGRATPPPVQEGTPTTAAPFDKSAAVKEAQKGIPTSNDRKDAEKREAQKVFDFIDKIPRSKRTHKEQEEYVLAKFTLGLIAE